MNEQSKLAFIRWTRSNHPDLYRRAIARVAARTGLQGLGDDLVQPISQFDPGSVSISDDTSQAIADAAAASDTSASDVIDSIANAITSIAPAVVNTQAQLSTIQINAQRAQRGIGPPLTSSSLLTGAGLGVGSIGLLALVAVGGFLLLKRG